MSLIEEVVGESGGAGLSGLEQLQALMASGRRPGIADSLDFACVGITAPPPIMPPISPVVGSI